jgi:hypothetical protein
VVSTEAVVSGEEEATRCSQPAMSAEGIPMSVSEHLSITRPRSRLQPCLQSALFASALQPSAALTPELVAEAISQTMRKLGRRGCDGAMAQEFGDHPEAAAERMRWIRQHLAETLTQGLAELDWQ